MLEVLFQRYKGNVEELRIPLYALDLLLVILQKQVLPQEGTEGEICYNDRKMCLVSCYIQNILFSG